MIKTISDDSYLEFHMKYGHNNVLMMEYLDHKIDGKQPFATLVCYLPFTFDTPDGKPPKDMNLIYIEDGGLYLIPVWEWQGKYEYVYYTTNIKRKGVFFGSVSKKTMQKNEIKLRCTVGLVGHYFINIAK